MNSRDSKLAYALLGFIVLAVTGFFGYQFYLVPMREREARIADLKRDVDEREARVDVIQAELPKLEKLRMISLPKDVDLCGALMAKRSRRCCAPAGSSLAISACCQKRRRRAPVPPSPTRSQFIPSCRSP